jgi:tRNA G18 (ribose-2'-O)-methylase SpoU
MRNIVLIAHNLRSSHNVGSLLRTADGLGVNEVLLTGYTPYPLSNNDKRLPHIAQKVGRQIEKTALGATTSAKWRHLDKIQPLLISLRKQGFVICALEQTKSAVALPAFAPCQKLVLIVGREVEGIEQEVLDACDLHLEIPMLGKKESLNVAQAAAIALYHCRFL